MTTTTLPRPTNPTVTPAATGHEEEARDETMSTTETKPRPEFCTDEHLEFLDDLRESGATNMYGAPQYIEEAFGMDRTEAREVVSYWMRTFSVRRAEAQS